MMKKRVRQNTTLESGKKTMAANSATVSCGRRRGEAVLFGCVFCLKTPWLVGSICHQNNFLWPKKNLSKYNFHHYCALRFSFIDWVKVNMQEEESQCTAVWGGNHTNVDSTVHTQNRLTPHHPPPSPAFIFPGLALTATWASFHSGLGCGARSWETSTAGPVSQNKAQVLDREREKERETQREEERQQVG